MRNAVKYRAYPNTEQERQLMQAFGNVRFVYNHSLAERQQIYELTGKTATSAGQQASLPILKKQYPWLALSPAVTQQQALRDLDDAYRRFFKGQNGFPKFKKKSGHQSIRFTNNKKRTAIRCEGSFIKVPCIGLIKCAFSKEVHGEITSATISMTPDGKFYISLALEQEDADAPDSLPLKETGIDLNCKDLAVLSDGTKYKNNRHLSKSEKKLAREQRRLSRKKGARKGEKKSKNYEKQRRKVAKVHQKTRNQRTDDIHRMTKEITDEYSFIALEDLNVKGMSKNHGLAKAVQDASFYEIKRQIQYKAERKGKTVVVVDRYYPSTQLCSECGTKNPALKGFTGLSIREWDCAACGAHHDRDVNSARNVLAEGLRIAAAT